MEVTRNYIKNFIFYALYLGTALGIPTFILLFNAKKAFCIGLGVGLVSAISITVWDSIQDEYKIPRMKKEVEKEHRIILYGGTSLMRELWKQDDANIGGVLFLIECCIFFREDIIENPYELMIDYRNIKKAKRYMHLHGGMKIYMKDGRSEKFMVEQPKIWITKIRELMEVTS